MYNKVVFGTPNRQKINIKGTQSLTLTKVSFTLFSDMLAIGDPNQSTILAVSIAGGIVLLIFLVACFVVSGR